MQMVQMNSNVPITKRPAELNHHNQDEDKEARDGVMGEGQGLSEEDESRINDDVEDIDDRQTGVNQVQVHKPADQQRSQQQPQGPLVHWERFLPLRSLKVLLVENDESTRHVVSALLRNCGYEVISVANGIQAWKILEDLTNHVDLVLSEVVMPCLSGIGLLCKIMSHKTCKTIPVIMMSSHDSMNIVFKCLSKGAVDFLVKPIRKNELKNLWQHVWRKCHSSSGSGSGSESGIRTQKSTKSKCLEESDNNTGSNDEDDIASSGLIVRDGSDNGSGTQSSWTKRAVEVESPQPMSPWDQSADPPDSTCAQVIHSRPEAFGSNWVPVITKEHGGQEDDHDAAIMGKDLEIGVPSIPDLRLGDPGEKGLTNMAWNNKDKLSELNLKNNGEKLEKGELELNNEKPNGELKTQVVDLIAVASNSNTDTQIESVVFDIPSNISKLPDMNDKTDDDKKEIPSVELSLKRLRDVRDTGRSAHDRNVLRHSGLSAFSRYNSASIANQAPTGNVGGCSPLVNNSEAAKTEPMQNLQSNSNSTPPNQCSNGSSNNNDMGSTTNNAFTKQVASDDKLPPKSTVKCLHPSSTFQTVHNAYVTPAPTTTQGKANSATTTTGLTQPRGVKQQVQVQHHHHHYHHHHHHVHNMGQNQQSSNDDLSLKNNAVVAPQCGSSNMLSAPMEGNVGNQSLNGSASGSNHGSNGQNGSTTALIARATKIESDNGVAGQVGTIGGSGSGSGSGSGFGSGVDQNCFTQREAALNKFRQKRKERCFDKKVRYQSRKKLAEQRPRVRGQFVRQENKGKDAHS